MDLASTRIRVVVPPIWPGVFGRTGARLAAGLEAVGISAEVEEARLDPAASLNIVLGWSVFRPEVPPDSRYILYQLEPLQLAPWPERLREAESLFAGALAIWEYSERNIGSLSRFRSRWVPLRRANEARGSTERPPPRWDVLFAGVMTPRREQLLQELSRRCCVSARLRWGDELDIALPYAKIVLNVHGSEAPTPLEQPRVAQALDHGCFVLTEASTDEPYGGLISAPYEDLPDTALAYLHDAWRRERARQDQLRAYAEAPSMGDELRSALEQLEMLPVGHAP